MVAIKLSEVRSSAALFAKPGQSSILDLGRNDLNCLVELRKAHDRCRKHYGLVVLAEKHQVFPIPSHDARPAVKTMSYSLTSSAWV